MYLLSRVSIMIHQEKSDTLKNTAFVIDDVSQVCVCASSKSADCRFLMYVCFLLCNKSRLQKGRVKYAQDVRKLQ